MKKKISSKIINAMKIMREKRRKNCPLNILTTITSNLKKSKKSTTKKKPFKKDIAVSIGIVTPKTRTQRAKNKMSKVMEEFKKGDLNIGKSKKKVKNRKQAIAIGISQMRKYK